ncbi:hypothetical protein M427DRAFT_29145 [Gonapodya prolifera JEL478]|uniref:Uncharacterized protein n=1 Tax=Gonapodya prolifera (strain JEL478) TaxID=1344416 RepID=A0A139AQZ3_GONPJ|nr:hypothetical protein M427DRAFT_29145 [Gonapodya prolifera JEL478]|eukprot:KXS19170.1 hypothetical protein M427DRAFT_29145 [Gonapodya prolifera JEL478]
MDVAASRPAAAHRQKSRGSLQSQAQQLEFELQTMPPLPSPLKPDSTIPTHPRLLRSAAATPTDTDTSPLPLPPNAPTEADHHRLHPLAIRTQPNHDADASKAYASIFTGIAPPPDLPRGARVNVDASQLYSPVLDDDTLYNAYASRPERELPQRTGYEKQKRVSLAYPGEHDKRKFSSAAPAISPLVVAISSILSVGSTLVPALSSARGLRRRKRDRSDDGSLAVSTSSVRDAGADEGEPLTPGSSGFGSQVAYRKTAGKFSHENMALSDYQK